MQIKIPQKNQKQLKHLIKNASRKFTRKILLPAPSHFRRRKILEVFFILLRKPTLIMIKLLCPYFVINIDFIYCLFSCIILLMSLLTLLIYIILIIDLYNLN